MVLAINKHIARAVLIGLTLCFSAAAHAQPSSVAEDESRGTETNEFLRGIYNRLHKQRVSQGQSYLDQATQALENTIEAAAEAAEPGRGAMSSVDKDFAVARASVAASSANTTAMLAADWAELQPSDFAFAEEVVAQTAAMAELAAQYAKQAEEGVEAERNKSLAERYADQAEAEADRAEGLAQMAEEAIQRAADNPEAAEEAAIAASAARMAALAARGAWLAARSSMLIDTDADQLSADRAAIKRTQQATERAEAARDRAQATAQRAR